MVENHIANIQLISEKYKKKQRKYCAELQNVNKAYSGRVRYAFVMCSLCIRNKCKKNTFTDNFRRRYYVFSILRKDIIPYLHVYALSDRGLPYAYA